MEEWEKRKHDVSSRRQKGGSSAFTIEMMITNIIFPRIIISLGH